MSVRPSGLLSRLLLAAITCALCTVAAVAQDTSNTNTAPAAPAPPAASAANFDDVQPTHWEIFAGYSWFSPGGGRVGATPLDRSITPGFAVSSSYFFNRNLGLELATDAHFGDNDKITNTTIGPIVRFPMAGVSPYIHAGVGFGTLSPVNVKNDYGAALRAGGGLDFYVPRWQHFKLRLLQADYIYARHDFFPILPRLNMESAELSSGIVFMAGPIYTGPPPTVACSANPTEVFAGEPVNVTVTPSNFNPKRTVSYSYTATGGKVSGNAANTTVDTNGLNPGSYTVTSTATDNHIKVPPTCTANFTVKEWPAPTVSCSANPTEVDPGQTATINCNGSTAKGNLQYSYKASAGNVTGEGPNATLNTEGAQPGPITVTGTVTDDRGKTASADTTVTVRAPQAPPPPPPPPQASKINQIAFPKAYSARVDNTAKAILDDVALRMQREPDSKLVIVGSTDAKETSKSRSRNLAAQRAVNTKAYLVDEKGIDASRIETRTDGTEGAQAEMWIVPTGASFNEPNTQVTNLPAAKARPAHRARHKAAAKRAPSAQ